MTIRHRLIAALLLAFPVAPVLPLLAQEPNPPEQQNQQLDPQSTPSEQPPAAEPQPAAEQPRPQPRPAPPARAGWHRFDVPDPVEHPALPMNLTLPTGTWLNVRVDQGLSSDHNKPGDLWTATLTQPLIVDGRILARRGQIVGGTVIEAQKAGHGKKESRLGLDLNQLTLADGRQVRVQSRLIEFHGPPVYRGREAAAVITTVAAGAAIGGAVGGGSGAGIGAAGGVVAATVGVMLTHGKPTILYPESQLTFRLEAPFVFAVNNETTLRAFAPVQADDYLSSQRGLRTSMNSQGSVRPPGVYAPYSYPYPYYYSPYYYSPFYYGPGYGVFLGGGRGWGGGWGGGFRGGFRGGRR